MPLGLLLIGLALLGYGLGVWAGVVGAVWLIAAGAGRLVRLREERRRRRPGKSPGQVIPLAPRRSFTRKSPGPKLASKEVPQ